MQVFNAFMKIVLKRISVPIMYIGIFLTISLFMMNSGAESDAKYKDQQLDISVIDLDDSKASQSLIDFLSIKNKVKKIEYDKDKVLSGIYYQNTDYVLTDNKNYEENLKAGKLDNLFTNYCANDSFGSVFGDRQVSRYISVVDSYLKSGTEFSEALNKAAALVTEETEVNTESFNSDKNENFFSGNSHYFFQYLPYIFISILITALSPTLLVLNRKEIRDRTNASCISTFRQTAQTTLGAVIYSFIIWAVFMTAFVLMCKENVFEKECLLAVINSFVFLIISLSLAMLISQFLKSEQTAGMIANVFGLGMAFLCGVFVPMEYLSKPVLTAAHFLPAYWFVKANNMLSGSGGEVFSNSEYMICIGMQLLFAAALFSLVFISARSKRKSA